MMRKSLFYILSFVFLSLSLSAQLSFLTVIDSFPGSESEFIPLPVGFLSLNASFDNNEDYAFRLTRFDKCGTVEWAREFRSEDNFLNGFGSPEAVMDRTGFIYTVLSHPEEQGEGILLVKMSQGGDIEWSYLLHGTQASGLNSQSNIVYSRFTDTLAITLNNERNNASIIQFDKDGAIIRAREFPGFRFHSSRMANDGSIVMAGDTAIIKVDSGLDLLWAKRINSSSFFVQSNDPVIETNGQINLMAVDTFGTQLDSFYYSLITLDEDGELVTNSDRVRGIHFGSVDLQERGPNTFLYLDRNLATIFQGNTSLFSGQTDMAFCADTIPFCSSNMNTCIDNSLLLSGFYYENPDTVQFFMGKTDPMGALNCNEKAAPADTLARVFVVMDSIHFDAFDFTIIQDTAAFEREEWTPEQIFPCFLAKVDDQSQEYTPCPCDEQPLAVSWLKGAEYLWSTGDTTNFITVDTTGIYTVDVNLCGTEQRSTFQVDYKSLSQCMQFADNSPLCPGLVTSLKVIHNYGGDLELNWSTGENGDSIHVTRAGSYTVNLYACGWSDSYTFDILYRDIEDEECKPVYVPNAFVPNSTMYEDNKVFKIYTKLEAAAFTTFNMQVFDRWGEKVFETDDPFEGWTGTFRNEYMPPGVYLYAISYELDLGGELISETETGQVVLIR